MYRTHLSFLFFLFVSGIAMLGTYFFGILGLILVSAVASIIIFLSRKRKIDVGDRATRASGLMASPCDGVVSAIVQTTDMLQVHLQIPPWNEWTLRAPVSSELTRSTVIEGKRAYPWTKLDGGTGRYTRLRLEFITKSQDSYAIEFVPTLGALPRIYPRPGDRAIGLGAIGDWPMGGKVILCLGDGRDVLVKIGEQVRMGEHLISNRVGATCE